MFLFYYATRICVSFQITPNGIRFLLSGNFAENAEVFPFQNWQLANVGKEEFQRLEKEFRSNCMR